MNLGLYNSYPKNDRLVSNDPLRNTLPEGHMLRSANGKYLLRQNQDNTFTINEMSGSCQKIDTYYRLNINPQIQGPFELRINDVNGRLQIKDGSANVTWSSDLPVPQQPIDSPFIAILNNFGHIDLINSRDEKYFTIGTL